MRPNPPTIAQTSTDEGTTYYYHKQSKETRWQLPDEVRFWCPDELEVRADAETAPHAKRGAALNSPGLEPGFGCVMEEPAKSSADHSQ